MKQDQIGGSHYAAQQMDPFTFAMANRWDVMMFSVLKYLSRYPVKGSPAQDLRKAAHIARYRAQFPKTARFTQQITMQQYIKENGFRGEQAYLLHDLDMAEYMTRVGDSQQMKNVLEGLARDLDREADEIASLPG